MTRPEASVEEKLARLATATDSVAPRDGFALRVMDRLGAQGGQVIALSDGHRHRPVLAPEQDDWSLQVLRLARVGMAIATIAAAAGVVLAWNGSALADQDEALGYGVAEAFE